MYSVENFFDLSILKISEENPDAIARIIHSHSVKSDIVAISPVTQDLAAVIGRDYFLVPEKIGYTKDLSRVESVDELYRKKDRSLRHLAESAVEVRIGDPLDPAQYADFLMLYANVMSEKERGVVKLDSGWQQKHPHAVGIFVYYEGTMIAGLLAKKIDQRLSVSYSALSKDFRRNNVYKFLAIRAMGYAKEKGMAEFSYGRDTNLYGHHLATGLYLFKRELDLRPTIPSKTNFLLRRFISLEKFQNPVFFFSVDDTSHPTLSGNIIFRDGTDPEIARGYKIADMRLNVFIWNGTTTNKIDEL